MARQGKSLQEVTATVFGWYQFSREANSEGLRCAYTRWSTPVSRRELKCEQPSISPKKFRVCESFAVRQLSARGW